MPRARTAAFVGNGCSPNLLMYNFPKAQTIEARTFFNFFGMHVK